MGVARDCIVGLDIGTTKVCTVVAEVEERGQVNIIGMGNSPSDGIRKGVVIDIESAAAAIVDSVEKARVMSGYDIRRVVVGVTGEHVETGALELARRAYGDDDDGAGSGVLVGSGGDGDGSAQGHGLLEIHRFALHVGWAFADEDDLANEVLLQDGEGAGGSDVAAADDGDACAVRWHNASFLSESAECGEIRSGAETILP